jgi:uncharacterized protein
MQSFVKSFFFFPVLVALVGCAVVGYLSGIEALFLVIILSVLETTLSFDNAVVNARVLERMSPLWQRRFLTWGIFLAVFGTRFVLPILIVSIALWLSPLYVTQLVLVNPTEYGHLLEQVHGSIIAFGAMFLLMVSLKYFFNKAKDVHWIQSIEAHLVKWGRIEAIEIALALGLLALISYYTPYDQVSVLTSGIIGIVLFISMQGITNSLSVEAEGIVKNSVGLFVYLEVLDAAFSLDGVIGAFALTSNLLIIVVGLGVGAFFVRTLTLYFVAQKTLVHLVYLEHGAHWAIFGLALAMLVSLIVHIPEAVTGFIGVCFVSLAYYSSIKAVRRGK